MGLGLPAGGESSPHIKYDARAGRFTRVDSKDQLFDITQGFAAIFDLQQIEVGFVRFATGLAPDFRMVRVGQTLPARPADLDTKGKPAFKQGFRLNIKLARALGGDTREFMSAAACVIQAMDELYSVYEAAPERGQGLLPVVAMTGTQIVTKTADGQKTTNYKPLFAIQGWQPRPADLPLTAPGQAVAPAPVAAPPAAVVPPPVAQPAPVQAPPPPPPPPPPVAAPAPVAATPAAQPAGAAPEF